MEKLKKRSFKNLLINPKFQAKYILLIVLIGLFVIGLNFYIYDLFTREYLETFAQMLNLSDQAVNHIEELTNELFRSMIIFSTVFATFSVILGIFISHRIAGPIFHFKKAFKEVANGNKSYRLILREGDELKDVANDFNFMMDRIEGKN